MVTDADDDDDNAGHHVTTVQPLGRHIAKDTPLRVQKRSDKQTNNSSQVSRN